MSGARTLCAAALLAALPALAEERRFALVVGDAKGGVGTRPLRYALVVIAAQRPRWGCSYQASGVAVSTTRASAHSVAMPMPIPMPSIPRTGTGAARLVYSR